MVRTPWVVEFTALEEEVAVLRRRVREHLGRWGLRDLVDEAQLCVSEFVANVITHVGVGTPTTLAVLMNGTFLRIEVHDPDTRALPTLVAADIESEGGRGMALIEAITDRWGVQLTAERKVTWCELATALTPLGGDGQDPSVTRAEALLNMYATLRPQFCSYERGPGRVSRAVAEESVIDVITDFLRWLQAHGFDVEEVLDHAQSRFETAVPASGR
ncbi:ATP-binding protein [Streptomyces sp. NPDC057596]|uniref:ATP-binding protein n=1 Tax=Streptomyces sp. NPDC057596 TaxID=3346178 RepID=UPI0036A03597